jgi:hypothetical protein
VLASSALKNGIVGDELVFLYMKLRIHGARVQGWVLSDRLLLITCLGCTSRNTQFLVEGLTTHNDHGYCNCTALFQRSLASTARPSDTISVSVKTRLRPLVLLRLVASV